jgi:hypothetical protein
MKILIAGMTLVSLIGCTSAGQKIVSKQGYRDAQVEAIRVQSDAGVYRQQALSAEKEAMWYALAEVVKANPDAASNVAIVAAVAAAKDEGPSKESGMALIKTENDVTALDWARVLVPSSIGAMSNVGIAAITNRTARAAIRTRAAVDIADIEMQGKVFDVLGTAVGGEDVVYNLGEGASMIGGDSLITTTSGDTVTDSYDQDNDTTNTTSGDTNTDSYNQDNDTTNTTTETTSGDSYADSNNTTDSSDNSDNSDNSDDNSTGGGT